MKLILSRSKTEKNYAPNKNMFNLSINKFKSRQNKLFNKSKNLTVKSFTNLEEEEYIPRLKYKITEEDSFNNKKNLF